MGHHRFGAARWSMVALAACAAASLPGWVAASGDLTPSEKRGQEVYLRGESPSGADITALMGREGAEVPGAVLPCGSCHGADGRGRPEGGVAPTNIAWASLTKPYGVRRPGGRNEPPYDERLLTRAIAMGLDSGGGELHAVMPRYRLTHEDMVDLVAYLKVIGSGEDPGLTPDAIRIGALLPRHGLFAPRAASVEAVLRAYFEELNQKGGIYNRRIELRVGEAGDPPEAAAAARRFLDAEHPFALTGVFMAGAEAEISDLAGEMGVPLVGALTATPRSDPLANRHVFYLDEGLDGQGRALIEFAARSRGEGSPALTILCRQGVLLDDVIETVERDARARGWDSIRTIRIEAAGFDPKALVRQMQADGTKMLFLLAAGAPESALLHEAARVGWSPQVLIPGLVAGAEVFDFPHDSAHQVFLAFATLPSDAAPGGLEEYRDLVKKYKLPDEFPAAQMASLSSAKILVEGLKRAGSELSREGLLAALEGLRDFDTKMTPYVTYGPNRRVGIRGAHIVSLDPAERRFVPVGDRVGAD